MDRPQQLIAKMREHDRVRTFPDKEEVGAIASDMAAVPVACPIGR